MPTHSPQRFSTYRYSACLATHPKQYLRLVCSSLSYCSTMSHLLQIRMLEPSLSDTNRLGSSPGCRTSASSGSNLVASTSNSAHRGVDPNVYSLLHMFTSFFLGYASRKRYSYADFLYKEYSTFHTSSPFFREVIFYLKGSLEEPFNL